MPPQHSSPSTLSTPWAQPATSRQLPPTCSPQSTPSHTSPGLLRTHGTYGCFGEHSVKKNLSLEVEKQTPSIFYLLIKRIHCS